MLVSSLAASLSFGFGFLGFHLSSVQDGRNDVVDQEIYSFLTKSASDQTAESIAGDSSNLQSPSYDAKAVSTRSLKENLLSISNGSWNRSRPLRILQLGDSHTAADFFTERLRSRLQMQYGDGGIGWILPGRVTGQNATRYLVSTSGNWKLNKGNVKYADSDTPLGGFINTGSSGALLVVQPLISGQGDWSFHALVRRSPGYSGPIHVSLAGAGHQTITQTISADWQSLHLGTDSPLASRYSLEIKSGRIEVGGLWLENNKNGIVVDHLGRNGATLSAITAWSDRAMTRQFISRPVDAIFIAYGTNEAAGTTSMEGYSRVLSSAIERLRLAAPTAEIFVITAPAFAKGSGSCRDYLPRSLHAVIAAQLMVGRERGVKVWNWMEAMGGPCGVDLWSRKGWMAGDRIHMTVAGYRQSADLMINWLHRQIVSSQ